MSLHSAFPILKSDRLLLRQFTAADQQMVFYGLSHPQVIPFYGVSYNTYEATKAQMDWFADLEKEQKGVWWAICRQADLAFVGAGGLNDWDHKSRKAELGFWLLPEYWGQGFMQEAIPLITRHAFKNMDIHRIEGFVESQNIACKKAMQKLGFIHEGTMRQCELKNESWIDLEIYALLSTD